MTAPTQRIAHAESDRRRSPAMSRRAAAAVLAAALHGPAAAVGIAYTEIGDAGDTAATAQSVTGAGAVDTIDGAIASALDVDVFRIAIVDAAAFSATTDGPTTINTILALFDAEGRGVYLNDANTSGVSSTLPAGHPFGPTAAGIYHLAVMSNPVNPLSGGVPMLGAFDTTAGFAVFRLDGAGAGAVVDGWTTPGNQTGTYRITLTGAAAVGLSEPAALGLLVCGVAGAAARRRRRR